VRKERRGEKPREEEEEEEEKKSDEVGIIQGGVDGDGDIGTNCTLENQKSAKEFKKLAGGTARCCQRLQCGIVSSWGSLEPQGRALQRGLLFLLLGLVMGLPHYAPWLALCFMLAPPPENDDSRESHQDQDEIEAIRVFVKAFNTISSLALTLVIHIDNPNPNPNPNLCLVQGIILSPNLGSTSTPLVGNRD